MNENYNENHFEWEINVKNEPVLIKESFSDFINNSENVDKQVDYSIHDMLRDYHFISYLRNINQDKEIRNKEEFIKYLHIINNYIGLFFDSVEKAFDSEDKAMAFLQNDELDEMTYSDVKKSMKGVLLTKTSERIKQFKFINYQQLLTENIEPKDYVIKAITETQKILFSDLFSIVDYFKRNAEKFKCLYRQYINGSSCFSITDVCFNNNNETIFTLSGINPKKKQELTESLNQIATQYPNSHCICFAPKDVDDVQYLDIRRNQLSYGNAKKQSYFSSDKHNRMFSCCERKTFAYMHSVYQDCIFKMYVKYPPCELCAPFVNFYINKWQGSEVYVGNYDKIICFNVNNQCKDNRRTWEEFAMKLNFTTPVSIK